MPRPTQFHNEQETDSILLMRHIHEQGFRDDGCTWQWAKQQGTGAIRAIGSKMIAEAVIRVGQSWLRGSEGGETPDVSFS